MSNLIDADVLLTWLSDNYDDEDVSVEYVSGIIEEQPEAIVRCGNCKYHHKSNGLPCCVLTEDNDYCSRAERR